MLKENFEICIDQILLQKFYWKDVFMCFRSWSYWMKNYDSLDPHAKRGRYFSIGCGHVCHFWWAINSGKIDMIEEYYDS